MKSKILSGIMLLAVLSFTACTEKKETTEKPVITEPADATAVAEPVEDTSDVTTATPAQEDVEIITVTGKVTEIYNGKDGYTAKIAATDGSTYSATISIPNLEKKYRRVNVGDNITVKGEVTNLESDVLIRVTEMQ